MGKQHRVEMTPRGINFDQPAEFVPDDQFNGAENITFRSSLINRAGGFLSVWQDPNPLPLDPNHLLYAPFQGTAYWLMMNKGGDVFVTDGTTHTEISPSPSFPAGDLNSWTSGELNGLAVFNNAEITPHYWPGSPVQVALPLPGFPEATTCYSIRPYKFHLIAMQITGPQGLDPSLLLWSDAAAPGQVPQSWTPGPGSEAGDNVLGDETGAIIDGLGLRDDFIIYKQRSVYIMSYIAGDEVMAFRKLFTNLGALNRNCIAEHQGRHYVLGDGDLYIHDGQTIQSIADSRVKRSFFQLMDANFFRGAYVAINKVENEVYFIAPTGGFEDARLGIIYDIDADSWGIRDIPSCPHAAAGTVITGTDPGEGQDWDTFPTFWQFANRRWNESSQTLGTIVDGLLFAQPSGPRVMFLDGDVTNRGLTVDARLDWLTHDMGTPETIKILRRIWPSIRAPQGSVFTIRGGGQIELADSINFDTQEFVVGVDRSVDVLVEGRYLSVQFESEIDVLWEMSGFGLEFEERGGF